MTYATAASVRAALTAADSGIDTVSAASLSDAQLLDSIAEADAVIDGHLTGRYALPITGAIPALVAILSRDMAAYYATLTWLGSVPLDDKHPVALRYAKAETNLGKIRDGKIMLVLPGPDAAQVSDSPVVENLYDGTMFPMSGFDLIREERGVAW